MVMASTLRCTTFEILNDITYYQISKGLVLGVEQVQLETSAPREVRKMTLDVALLGSGG